MSGQPWLVGVVEGRAHDLPPKWDGRRVEWRDMTTSRVLCGEPPEPCTRCGDEGWPWNSAGIVYPLAGETTENYVEKKLPSGKTFEKKVARPSRQYLRLIAYRCLNCRLDLVWDTDKGEWWELDESDYGDNGSVAS